MVAEFKTTHNLPFEVAPWEYSFLLNEEFERFRIGTCKGIWGCTEKFYEIIAVVNSCPGNGHFEDVLEWFEHSCKRDKRGLKIREVVNKKFKEHLLKKRGFIKCGMDDVLKKF